MSGPVSDFSAKFGPELIKAFCFEINTVQDERV